MNNLRHHDDFCNNHLNKNVVTRLVEEILRLSFANMFLPHILAYHCVVVRLLRLSCEVSRLYFAIAARLQTIKTLRPWLDKTQWVKSSKNLQPEIFLLLQSIFFKGKRGFIVRRGCSEKAKHD